MCVYVCVCVVKYVQCTLLCIIPYTVRSVYVVLPKQGTTAWESWLRDPASRFVRQMVEKGRSGGAIIVGMIGLTLHIADGFRLIKHTVHKACGYDWLDVAHSGWC